jgi:acetyl-CoA synthetase
MADGFKAARDFLLAHRTDYRTAYRDFRWPELDRFRHVRATAAPYKRVRRIEFCDFPKTISGKILRVELRQAESERAKNGERARDEFREEEFPELTG